MSARRGSVRRRLLSSSVLVALTAVVLLGVPLGLAGSRVVKDAAQQRLERTGRTVLDTVRDRLEHGESIDPARLEALLPVGVNVLITTHSGQTVLAGPRSQDEQQSLTLPTTPDGITVTVAERDDGVRHRQDKVWLLVGLVGLAAVTAATVLAARQARGLSALLDELAQAADRLGSGDLRPYDRRFHLAELDRVARVLDRSGQRLGNLLQRERDVSALVSHQLRTPLAAISLRLEEVSELRRDPEAVRTGVDAALEQLDRLTDTVDHLVAHARERTGSSPQVAGAAAAPSGPLSPVDTVDEPVDAAAVVTTTVDELSPLFAREGRRVRRTGDRGPVLALIAPGSLAQALSVLLENALRHGAGAVTVDVREALTTTTARRRAVTVSVSDEGAGVAGRPAGLLARDAGGGEPGDPVGGRRLGLPLARALVESAGGRLELADAAHARFVLYLPGRATALSGERPDAAPPAVAAAAGTLTSRTAVQGPLATGPAASTSGAEQA